MKTAIVTGASGNLGQAVVKKFLSEGFNVIGSFVPNDPVREEIKDEHFEKVIVDLSDEAGSERFINEVCGKYKTIDVVVATVGGFAMGSIHETKTGDISKQISLNFETAYNVARPAFGRMLEQNSGRIFLVGSRPGLASVHGKGMVAYGLAKSLIFRLAEIMNAEAKGRNVVTSVLVPSTIDTPQNRSAMPAADPGDWVKPGDIADTIYYYCTDAAAALREPVIKLYNNA